MTTRGACVVLLVCALGAVAAAERAKGWSITPPAGWADHSPAANTQTTVDELKTKLAAVGGKYDLGLWEADAENRLTLLYMVVPGKEAGAKSRVRGWEDGARNGVNETAKEISYKRTETDQLIVVEQVSQGGGKSFRSVRFSGIDATNALVGIQASCSGPETVCGPALASLRLDASTFKKLKLDGAAAAREESKDSAYQAGRFVGMILVIVLVGWFLVSLARRRSGPAT